MNIIPNTYKAAFIVYGAIAALQVATFSLTVIWFGPPPENMGWVLPVAFWLIAAFSFLAGCMLGAGAKSGEWNTKSDADSPRQDQTSG